MKNILTLFSGFFLLLLGSYSLSAQVFTVAADTVHVPAFTGIVTPHDDVKNTTANDLTIKWHVDSTDFPADWLAGSAFGICDCNICRINVGGAVWNPSTNSGSTYSAIYGANAAHDSVGTFDLSLDYRFVTTNGTHWITITLWDNASGYSKTITYIVNRVANAVPTVANSSSEVNLYPNPATSELNLVYDAGADVKNIVVYNIIGKVMTVYKVTGNSANLNLENLSSGIYFVRLMNSHGAMVATKKFTKQ